MLVDANQIPCSVWVVGMALALIITVFPAGLLTGCFFTLSWQLIGWHESLQFGRAFLVLFACLTVFFVLRNSAPRLPPGSRGPKGIPFFGVLLLYISNRFKLPTWFYHMSKVHGTLTKESDRKAAGGAQNKSVSPHRRAASQQDCSAHGCEKSSCAAAWQWTVVRRCVLPSGVITCLNSPSNVRHVLSDNFENYVKAPIFKEITEEIIGNGIFSSDGAVWKMHRKIASHMFSRRMLRGSAKVSVAGAQSVINRLQNLHFEKEGLTLDMQDIFFSFTLDVFSEIAFGSKLNTVSGSDKHPFATAFDYVSAHSLKRFGSPLWRLRRLFWCCFSAERAFRKSL